ALREGWMRAVPALAAGLLITVNPLLWEYAQEVRAYVAVPLIALLLLYSAARLLHRQPPRMGDWALVFAVQCVGLYTHNLVVRWWPGSTSRWVLAGWSGSAGAG
ncbi:MAG: hypothetical protein HC915_13660, partial [Anaerolineae bacterium]|nr:hypothetical protein [Anaerolineae bacterium]